MTKKKTKYDPKNYIHIGRIYTDWTVCSVCKLKLNFPKLRKLETVRAESV